MRTHVTRKGTTVFETAPIDRSGTSPDDKSASTPSERSPSRERPPKASLRNTWQRHRLRCPRDLPDHQRGALVEILPRWMKSSRAQTVGGKHDEIQLGTHPSAFTRSGGDRGMVPGQIGRRNHKIPAARRLNAHRPQPWRDKRFSSPERCREKPPTLRLRRILGLDHFGLDGD